jgi:hypothetical protein
VLIALDIDISIIDNKGMKNERKEINGSQLKGVKSGDHSLSPVGSFTVFEKEKFEN